MKKFIALCLALACVLIFVGCAKDGNEPNQPAETGYPSGEIQQPQIMYNGQIYLYFATGFGEPLPERFELVGSISTVDNISEPTSDFCGARVNEGQEIYANESIPDTVYLKYENGYAKFSVK